MALLKNPNQKRSLKYSCGREIHYPTFSVRGFGPSKKGTNDEIQLTDSLSSQIGKAPFYAYNFIGTRYDCGTKIGFTKANTNFALKDDEIGKEYNDWLSSLLKN